MSLQGLELFLRLDRFSESVTFSSGLRRRVTELLDNILSLGLRQSDVFSISLQLALPESNSIRDWALETGAGGALNRLKALEVASW